MKQKPFENIVTKWEIAQNEQFLLNSTMFSTLFNNYIINYRNISFFCPDNFKVVCCKFVIILCGKALNINQFLPLRVEGRALSLIRWYQKGLEYEFKCVESDIKQHSIGRWCVVATIEVKVASVTLSHTQFCSRRLNIVAKAEIDHDEHLYPFATLLLRIVCWRASESVYMWKGVTKVHLLENCFWASLIFTVWSESALFAN